MDKVKLAEDEFGMLDGVRIKMNEETTKLWFEKVEDEDGKEVVVMHLALTFQKSAAIKIGEDEVEVPYLGAFKFGTPSFLRGGFENLIASIETEPDAGGIRRVRLQSSNRDFDMKTKGIKRENGGAAR